MLSVTHYRWLNVETGGTGISPFGPAQHPAFADPQGSSPRDLERAAAACIRNWNRSFCGVVWHYERIDVSEEPSSAPKGEGDTKPSKQQEVATP